MNNAHARATTDGAGFKVLPRCDITWRILFAYWPVFVAMGPADPRLWSLRILHSGRRCAIQRCSSKEGRIQHSHWQSSAVSPPVALTAGWETLPATYRLIQGERIMERGQMPDFNPFVTLPLTQAHSIISSGAQDARACREIASRKG